MWILAPKLLVEFWFLAEFLPNLSVSFSFIRILISVKFRSRFGFGRILVLFEFQFWSNFDFGRSSVLVEFPCELKFQHFTKLVVTIFAPKLFFLPLCNIFVKFSGDFNASKAHIARFLRLLMLLTGVKLVIILRGVASGRPALLSARSSVGRNYSALHRLVLSSQYWSSGAPTRRFDSFTLVSLKDRKMERNKKRNVT